MAIKVTGIEDEEVSMIMQRKKLTIALLLLLCAAFVWAGGEQEKPAGKAAEKSEEPVTITVWNFKYGEEIAGKAFKKMDQMFMEKHPNIKIDHVSQPHDNYYEVLGPAIAAKTGPDVALSHTDQRTWNLSQSYVKLNQYVQSWMDEFPQTAWEACSEGGNPSKGIKMVPLTAQGLGMYYNIPNLEDAGVDPKNPPKVWSDFLTACGKLKQSEITPIVTGNNGQPYGVDFLHRITLCNYYGKEGIEGFSNGESNFTDPEFKKLTEKVKRLYTEGYITKEAGAIPYFMDAIEKFKAGEGGFFIGLTSDIAHWKDFGDTLGKKNVGYFPSINFPDAQYKDRQVNQGAGLGMVALTYSDHVEESVTYISEYVRGDIARVFVEATGAIVPNKNIDFGALGYDILVEIVDYMNDNAVPDFYTMLDSGTAQEMYNYFQLFYNADEVSIDGYIKGLQNSYEMNLE